MSWWTDDLLRFPDLDILLRGEGLVLSDLRKEVEEIHKKSDKSVWTLEERVKVLELDKLELKLRLAALVHLLVSKNLVTAEEIASRIRAERADQPGRGSPEVNE